MKYTVTCSLYSDRLLYGLRIYNEKKTILQNQAHFRKTAITDPKLTIPYKLGTVTTVVTHNCTSDHSVKDISHKFVCENEKNMRDSEQPIDDLKEYEEFISEFLSRRKLKMTDTRQQKRTEDHSKRLTKVLGKRKNLLRYRINDADVSKSFACDSQFVNNTHFFYGDGSRLGHNHREKHYALDFPLNTRLNKTDFTKHLQSLTVNYTNVNNEWLTSTKNILKPGTRIRSRSAPNIRLKTDKAYDRLPKGYDSWKENYPMLYNVDQNFELPKYLCSDYESFAKSLTRTMNNLTENIDPIDLKPGWQPISSILFSTFDNHFYALIEPPSDTLKKFSSCWDSILRNRPYKTRDERKSWEKKNVILHLEEFDSEGTRFRRARHVWSRKNEDWFIEMDTGKIFDFTPPIWKWKFEKEFRIDGIFPKNTKLRMIENTGYNDVMRLPPDQCLQPSAIIECRFRNTNMTQEDVAREINKIRVDGKLYIVGFDNTSERPSYDTLFQYIRKRPPTFERKTIKTAIIEPVPSPQKPLMTTVFCGSLNCTGCYSWRAFKKPIKEPTKKKVVFACELNNVFEWSD